MSEKFTIEIVVRRNGRKLASAAIDVEGVDELGIAYCDSKMVDKYGELLMKGVGEKLSETVWFDKLFRPMLPKVKHRAESLK